MRTNTKSTHIRYNQRVRPHHQVIAELVSKYSQSGASVLDIGCGVGNTVIELEKIKENLQISILDIDKECIEITISKAKNIIEKNKYLTRAFKYFPVISAIDLP